MLNKKNHKQLYIIDPWEHLGEKRLKSLRKSWAGIFHKEILPELPVDHFRKHYSLGKGRPTKELYSMVGLMILQQMHDLSDQEAVAQFCFNIQWQYALHMTNPADTCSYVSLKTVWTMRQLMAEDGFHDVLFTCIGKKLAKLFKLDFQHQRIDSVHVQSNMRHLGRISLFVETIRKFLLNLKRQQRAQFDQLEPATRRRYLDSKEKAVFALVKPSKSHARLDQLAKDTFYLVERFSSVEDINSMSSFKLLVRLFQEQCISSEQDGKPLVVAKANEDVASDSMQNPSDPDAGYSGHKGKGYQVQVMETYDPSSSKDDGVVKTLYLRRCCNFSIITTYLSTLK